ncbi:MAG: hypothetical protein AAB492_02145 [Patescibacteria group bacterium]
MKIESELQSKTIIFLLSSILVLLVIILFGPSVRDFLHRKSIINNSSIYLLWDVRPDCEKLPDDWNTADPIDVKKCTDKWKEYKGKYKKVFDKLIMSKESIVCSDFNNRWDALLFYEYTGGDTVFTPEAVPDRSPYKLDSNKDGMPCEELHL